MRSPCFLLVFLLTAACSDDSGQAGTAAGAAGAVAGSQGGTSAGQAGAASGAGGTTDPTGTGGTAGQGGAAGTAGQGGAAGMAGAPACIAGATRCAQSVVESCSDQGQWQLEVTCTLPQSCQQGACADPSETQLAQVASLEAYVDTMLAQTGYFGPLDGEALKQAGRWRIWAGDGSELTFLTAMRGAYLGIPQGHQALFLSDSKACAQPGVSYASESRLGVCGRPHPEGVVVTFARSDNVLGLQPGDVVLQADDDAGSALLERSARRPVCSGASSPGAPHRLETAATTFFGHVPGGTVLRVRRGATESFTLEVPLDGGSQFLSCQDPLGRAIDFDAKAELRPDGIAVIRLPRFYPIEGGPPPQTEAELEVFIAAFQAKVQAVFDQVKDAPGLIWDVRSNYGGITRVGLAIVAGMAGAKAGPLSSCRGRIPKSQPPKFYAQKYAEYEVVSTTHS